MCRCCAPTGRTQLEQLSLSRHVAAEQPGAPAVRQQEEGILEAVETSKEY